MIEKILLQTWNKTSFAFGSRTQIVKIGMS